MQEQDGRSGLNDGLPAHALARDHLHPNRLVRCLDNGDVL